MALTLAEVIRAVRDRSVRLAAAAGTLALYIARSALVTFRPESFDCANHASSERLH